MKSKVSIRNVCKKFDNKIILEHVNFEVPNNQIVGIIGRNGSGKTVLLKIICGLYIPTSGQIKIDGKIIDSDRPNNISALIDTGFLNNETGLKNLKILSSLTKNINLNDIYKVMEVVGLNPNNKTKYKNYSTGMKQRLKFAQILLDNNDLLILDEPFNGIDKETVKLFRTIILDLKNGGKTILITSHYQEDINLLCDIVYEMDAGKLKKVEVANESKKS